VTLKAVPVRLIERGSSGIVRDDESSTDDGSSAADAARNVWNDSTDAARDDICEAYNVLGREGLEVGTEHIEQRIRDAWFEMLADEC
jgi:hypothetical protein